jgi:hypothetical protein
MESGNYAVVEVARHLVWNGQKLIPEIVAGSDKGIESANSFVNMLLTMGQ